MTEVVRINATVDRALLDRVDRYAERHSEDRSTAIRQLLRAALRQLATDEAVTAYRQGRLTIRQLAAMLELDMWGAHDLLQSRASPSPREPLARQRPISKMCSSPPNEGRFPHPVSAVHRLRRGDQRDLSRVVAPSSTGQL